MPDQYQLARLYDDCPKTVDGEAVIRGRLWFRCDGRARWMSVRSVFHSSGFDQPSGWSGKDDDGVDIELSTYQAYSSRQALQDALDAGTAIDANDQRLEDDWSVSVLEAIRDELESRNDNG